MVSGVLGAGRGVRGPAAGPVRRRGADRTPLDHRRPLRRPLRQRGRQLQRHAEGVLLLRRQRVLHPAPALLGGLRPPVPVAVPGGRRHGPATPIPTGCRSTRPSRVWPKRWGSTRSDWSATRRAMEPVRRATGGTGTSGGGPAPTTGSTGIRRADHPNLGTIERGPVLRPARPHRLGRDQGWAAGRRPRADPPRAGPPHPRSVRRGKRRSPVRPAPPTTAEAPRSAWGWCGATWPGLARRARSPPERRHRRVSGVSDGHGRRPAPGQAADVRVDGADPGVRRAGAEGPERRRVRLHLLAGHRPGGHRRRHRDRAADRRPAGHHLPRAPRPGGQGGAARPAGGRDPHPSHRGQRWQGRGHAHLPSTLGPGAVDRHRRIGHPHRRRRRPGRPRCGQPSR